MHDIDFLPTHYRQQHAQQQWTTLRVLVLAALPALLAGAAWSQHDCRQKRTRRLAALAGQYALSQEQNNQLLQAQTELQQARHTSELYTYLRHPWPRTQLLCALLRPLPEAITLEQVQISCEEPAGRAPVERRGRSRRSSEEQQTASLLPAERDLKQLRDRLDGRRTVVRIEGITSHSAAVTRYLGELERTSLFTQAELLEIESLDNRDGAAVEFQALLEVRPGYGQPNGPAEPKQADSGHARPPRSQRGPPR